MIPSALKHQIISQVNSRDYFLKYENEHYCLGFFKKRGNKLYFGQVYCATLDGKVVERWSFEVDRSWSDLQGLTGCAGPHRIAISEIFPNFSVRSEPKPVADDVTDSLFRFSVSSILDQSFDMLQFLLESAPENINYREGRALMVVGDYLGNRYKVDISLHNNGESLFISQGIKYPNPNFECDDEELIELGVDVESEYLFNYYSFIELLNLDQSFVKDTETPKRLESIVSTIRLC